MPFDLVVRGLRRNATRTSTVDDDDVEASDARLTEARLPLLDRLDGLFPRSLTSGAIAWMDITIG